MTPKRIIRLGAAAAVLSALIGDASGGLCAQAWLREMPSAESSISSITGSDPIDRAARRQATLAILLSILRARAQAEGLDPNTPGALGSRYADYGAASVVVGGEVKTLNGSCSGPDCPGPRFSALMVSYSTSSPFRRDLLTSTFSQQWLVDYAAIDPTVAVLLGLRSPQSATGPRLYGLSSRILYALGGVAVVLVGIGILALGIRIGSKAERYQLTHTTSGGLIEGDTLADLRRYRVAQVAVKWLYFIGFATILFGLLGIGISLWGPEV